MMWAVYGFTVMTAVGVALWTPILIRAIQNRLKNGAGGLMFAVWLVGYVGVGLLLAWTVPIRFARLVWLWYWRIRRNRGIIEEKVGAQVRHEASKASHSGETT